MVEQLTFYIVPFHHANLPILSELQVRLSTRLFAWCNYKSLASMVPCAYYTISYADVPAHQRPHTAASPYLTTLLIATKEKTDTTPRVGISNEKDLLNLT